MEIFKLILLIYFTSLFSVTVLPKLSIFSAMPSLILIISLLFLFQNDLKKGLIWGLIGGLFLGFLSLSLLSNILAAAVIILLVWFLIKKFFESSNIYIFLTFCFFGSLVYNILLFPTYQLPIITHYLINAAYSTVFGLILYLIYQKRTKKSYSISGLG